MLSVFPSQSQCRQPEGPEICPASRVIEVLQTAVNFFIGLVIDRANLSDQQHKSPDPDSPVMTRAFRSVGPILFFYGFI